MLRSYLVLTIRNLIRQKLFTTINITGLAAGLSCCMLILLYVGDELSYDRFHTKSDRIYRINWTSELSGENRQSAYTVIPLAEVITHDLPEVEAVTRLYNRSGSVQIQDEKKQDIKFHEQQVCFTDSTFFRIFSLKFLAGNPDLALTEPNSVVITDEMAQKYFGKIDIIGKPLLYDNKTLLKITGVVEKLPNQTDIDFDILISFETLYSVESKEISDYLQSDWLYNTSYTFVLLKPNYRPEQVETQLSELLKKYADERVKQHITLSLQPLDQIHLYADDVEENPSTGSITYIYIFTAIAFITLLIASVNFVNLAMASSLQRAKEVGLRKVLGARPRQLALQFLGESVLICLLAFLLAFFLTQQFLPLLNEVTEKQLTLKPVGSSYFWLACIGLLLLTSLFAGAYPAFVMSWFEPIRALKGKIRGISQGSLLRKTLIVAQFSTSFILIVGAVVIYQQLQYLRNKPLGFQKEQILIVPVFGSNASSISHAVDATQRGRMNTFENELMKVSHISGVTTASSMPGNGFIRGLVIPQGFSEQDNLFVPWISVDYDFISTFRIPLVAGRDFSKETGADHLQSFILNETAVRMFGWENPQEAIGKKIIRGDQQNGKNGSVIGVIKDFHFNSLTQPLEPLILDVNPSRFTEFAVSLQPRHTPETITYIKKQWDATFPERVFEYSFLDQNINAIYNTQANLGKTIGYFAGITIFISCLGLFGLTSLFALQRTKEIGIRKVLGASVKGIVLLLSKELIALVGIALVIGTPVTWYAIQWWLQNFAFKINLSWWIFLQAGIVALTLAWLAISYQTIKVALTNPVDSLKQE